MEQIQAETPRKDLSPEPEPIQQSRRRLLKKAKRTEDQSSTTNKLPVEVNHPKKPLQGWAGGGWWKSSDGGEMLMGRSRSRAGDQIFKILNLRSSENTLLQVDGDAVEATEVEDQGQHGGETDDPLGS